MDSMSFQAVGAMSKPTQTGESLHVSSDISKRRSLSRLRYRHSVALGYTHTHNRRGSRRRNASPRHALTLLGKLIRRRIQRSAIFVPSTPLRRPKRRSPSYVFTIISSILKQRITRSFVFTRGMSIVSQLSSCTLASLSERSITTASKNSTQDPFVVSPTPVDIELESDEDNEMQNSSGQLMGKITIAEDKQQDYHGVDSNLNAIRHEAENNASKPSKFPTTRAARLRLRRKVVARRGLVARSIGRPKLNQGTKVRSKPLKTFDRLSKKGRKLKFLRKRCLRLKKDDQTATTSASLAIDTARQQNEKSPKEKLSPVVKQTTTESNEVKRQKEPTTSTQNKTTISATPKQKINEAAENKMESKRKRRCRKKTAALLNQFIAGGSSHGSPCEGKETKNKSHRRSTRQARPYREASFTKSLSRSSLSSSHACVKNHSIDSTDWPSLPESGRPKGLVKDTAKEIVKTKQGGSVAKMTRKRWADIVASRTKDENPCQQIKTTSSQKRQQSSGSKDVGEQRTWASVAANLKTADKDCTVNPVAAKSNEPDTMAETIVSSASRASSNASVSNMMKRKRSGSRLAYTDRLWGSGPKGRGKPQSQKFYRKHYGDSEGKERKRNAIRSRRNKMKQRSEQADQEKGSSVSRERKQVSDTDKPSTSGHTMPAKANTATDNDDRHDWCIDNMSVVYTKPVGSVISLKDPPESKVKASQGINKCNNRTVTPSKTRAVLNKVVTRATTRSRADNEATDSGMDLCDRLSSMSFQSSHGSSEKTCGKRCETQTLETKKTHQKACKNKAQGLGFHLKDSKLHHDNREPGKEKKISREYRALLRGGNGRLDAKTVTELHSRSKKTDQLWQDKVVTRAMQRRQRRALQESQHNTQRSPSIATESRKTSGGAAARKSTKTSRPHTSNTQPDLPPGTHTVTSEGSTSHTDKEDEEKTWRPTDNSGANNSLEGVSPSASSNRPFISRWSTDLVSPSYARSAPELAKRQSNICVELHPVTSDNLDMGWWHAYFKEPDSPADRKNCVRRSARHKFAK